MPAGAPRTPTLTLAPRSATPPLENLVDDFLNSCRARGLSPATIHRGYGHPLRRAFLPWCLDNGIEEASQITQRVIDRWTASLLDRGAVQGRELSRFTVHSYARTVSQFLAWARREGEEVNAKPQLPRLPRVLIDVLSRKEIEQLELAATTDRDRLIIRLLADTGMRVGELCNLHLDDLVRMDRRTFLKVSGKGAQERLVPLTPQLVRGVERQIRSHPRDATSDRLFVGLRRAPGGGFEPLTGSGVLQILKNTAERGGMSRRVHPHLFRHSFATEALRRGMNPVQLARILGHGSLRMIERTYSHLTPTDGYDALMRFFASD